MRHWLLFAVMFLWPLANVFAQDLYPAAGIEDAHIVSVAVSPNDPNALRAASDNALFASLDGGQNFTKLAVFKDEPVRALVWDTTQDSPVYLATSRHLYRINRKTETIFSAPDEMEILCLARHQNTIYVGTSTNLYRASTKDWNWQKIMNADNPVYAICPANGKLYFAAGSGVFTYNSGGLERLFKFNNSEEYTGLIPSALLADQTDRARIWLGTNRGIYVAGDSGRSWQKLSISGLLNSNITYLGQAADKTSLFIGTDHGLFSLKGPDDQFPECISQTNVTWAAFGSENTIYLATAHGLLTNNLPAVKTSASGQESDPPIEELQEIALRYNHVHPETINSWRRRLKARALFPTVSVSYDKSVYGSYSLSTTSGKGYGGSYVGPRDWGLTLSWDAADLIWNTYEDDVDTRARLNAQLRFDIIDEINRVYFERLRLKQELAEADFAPEETAAKSLKLQELTAILDGYTGGYFSKKVKELCQTER